MKYYSEKPEIETKIFGRPVILDHHPFYKSATLFEENGRKIYIVQQHFDEERKTCYWGEIDPWIANRIYLSPSWPEFFLEQTESGISINSFWQLRKLMWKLRMKPLPREPWENYFGRER